MSKPNDSVLLTDNLTKIVPIRWGSWNETGPHRMRQLLINPAPRAHPARTAAARSFRGARLQLPQWQLLGEATKPPATTLAR